MKNITLLVILLSLSFFFKIESVKGQETKKVTIEAFNNMDSESQNRYLEVFAKALSIDTNYIQMQQTSHKVQSYMLQMRKVKVDTLSKPVDRKDQFNYYKQRGISDPDDFLKSRKQMLYYTAKLGSVYPIYGKLDRDLMRTVIRRANSLIKQ